MWRRMVTRSQWSWPLCLDSIPRVPHVQQDSHLWLWWLWEYRWGGASPPCSTTWSFKALWTPGIAIRAASLASPKCELASAIQYIKTRRSQRWCIFWWILCYRAWVVYIYIYTFPCHVSLYTIKTRWSCGKCAILALCLKYQRLFRALILRWRDAKKKYVLLKAQGRTFTNCKDVSRNLKT